MPLLNLTLPNQSVDVVAVLDADFNQVFGGARPMKATVSETSKVMEHPVETGVTITDHRIIMPVEIELSMLIGLDYRSVYQQIKQLWRNATLLTVQTRTDSYPNMLISDIPHDETGEMFDVAPLAIKMREVLFVTPQFGALPAKKVANKKQQSTVSRGEVQTTNKAGNPSVLYGLFFDKNGGQ
jgi:hypothetical protein